MANTHETKSFTGHLHRNSIYESDDNCGTCDGARCDTCKTRIIVDAFVYELEGKRRHIEKNIYTGFSREEADKAKEEWKDKELICIATSITQAARLSIQGQSIDVLLVTNQYNELMDVLHSEEFKDDLWRFRSETWWLNATKIINLKENSKKIPDKTLFTYEEFEEFVNEFIDDKSILSMVKMES